MGLPVPVEEQFKILTVNLWQALMRVWEPVQLAQPNPKRLARYREASGVFGLSQTLRWLESLIKDGCLINHHCYNIVADICSSERRTGEVIFSHIYREATQVANVFAKHGLALNGVATIFKSLLDFIYFTMLADNSGIVFPRHF